jgi:hypothetical protein
MQTQSEEEIRVKEQIRICSVRYLTAAVLISWAIIIVLVVAMAERGR